MDNILTKTTITRSLLRKLEHIEASYWMQYYNIDGPIKSYASIIDDGVACSIPEIDVLVLNRVIGFGSQTEISQATIEHVIDFYRKAGSNRFMLQLPPQLVDTELDMLLRKFNFKHHNNWTKLYRNTENIEIKQASDLTIELIDKQNADLFAQIIYMSFDWKDTRIIPWLASVVGAPGYRHYVVRKSGSAIAAGALYIDGEMGSLAFAGTLPNFRGLGAQSLLIQKRLKDAFNAGVITLTAETAEETPTKKVNSYRNMIRHGFNAAYQRQNWLFEF